MANLKLRNKTVVEYLAVFLGPWTWVYTFQRNSLKAAVGLAIDLTTLLFFIFNSVRNDQEASAVARAQDHLRSMDGGLANLGFLIFLVAFSAIWFAIWLWAVLDAVYVYRDAEDAVIPHQHKSATKSLLLAVFLGPWTWLYTYSNDWWKFWPAILVGYTSLYIGIGVPYYVTLGLLRYAFPSLFLGVWALSIVSAAVEYARGRKSRVSAAT